MGRTSSKAFLYQAVGAAMALLVAGIFVWDIWRGPADAPQAAAVKIFKTPLEVLKSGDEKSPGLVAWAAEWKAQASTRPAQDDATARRLQTLQLAIDQGHQSAMSCFQVCKIMEDGNDMPAAELWATAGMTRAEAQLAGSDKHDRSVFPLLDAIRSAEEPLWLDYRNGPLLERITSILMRFERSAEWDQRPEWAKIGHGESLYMQARFPEAYEEAQAMTADAAKPGSYYTDEQKVGIHWLQALLLYGSYRYAQAVPHLEMVADFPTFHHSKDAWPLLLLSLSHEGQANLADARYRQYVERYHPDSSEMTRLKKQMERAKVLPP